MKIINYVKHLMMYGNCILIVIMVSMFYYSNTSKLNDENCNQMIIFDEAVPEAQKRYVELEYIETISTSTAFNTGVKTNSNSAYEIKFALTKKDSYGNILNAGSSWKNLTRIRQEKNAINSAYGWYKDNIYTPKIDEIVTIKQESNITYINGKKVRTATKQEFETDTNVIIGAVNARIYALKFWDENNQLVRDYIPVLDENNTPALYDKISNTYCYNSGKVNYKEKDNSSSDDSFVPEVDDSITKIIVKNDLELYVGDTKAITFTTVPEKSSEKVSFSSSNSNVVKVESNGKVKGIAKGEATITLQSKNVKANCNVIVKEKEKQESNKNDDNKEDNEDNKRNENIELEYVEMTKSNKGFDTGVKVNSNSSYEIKFALTKKDSYGNILNAGSSWKNLTRIRQQKNAINSAYGWYKDNIYTPKIEEVMTIKQEANITYINGKKVITATKQEFETDNTVVIGAAALRIYSFKIWDEDNKLLRDYIPVLDKNNKVSLYDKVSNTYIYNNTDLKYKVKEIDDVKKEDEAEKENEDKKDKDDFSDINLWQKGHYSMYTGVYENWNGRICLKELVDTDVAIKYEANIGDATYNFVIRQLDSEKKFIKTNVLSNNQTFITEPETKYLAISLYCPSNANVTFEKYKNLINNGMILKLVNKGQEIVTETDIKFAETNMYMKVGEEKAVNIKISPDNATYKNVKFTSSNNNVVIVDNNVVKAISEGTAIITATSNKGLTSKCTIKVLANREVKSLADYLENINKAQTPTLEYLGNPLANKYKDNDAKRLWARNPWDLYTYQNKVFIGSGDFGLLSNQGPVDIYYLDGDTEKFVLTSTVQDEQSARFREIDGELYMPGIDPRLWGVGYLYKFNGKTWDIVVTVNKGIHAWDYIKYNNKYYFASTSESSNSSPILSSNDGKTFEPVPCYLNAEDASKGLNINKKFGASDAAFFRAYELMSLNGKLYAYLDNHYKVRGMYEYNEEKNYFVRMPYGYGEPGTEYYSVMYANNEVLTTGIFENNKPVKIPDIHKRFFVYRKSRNEEYFDIIQKYEFNDKLVYINVGDLRYTTDFINFETLNNFGNEYFTDMLKSEDMLILLTYEKNADGTYTNKIYKTKDMKEFVEVINVQTKVLMRSMEYVDGRIILAAGVEHKDVNNDCGKIYKIELEKILK